MYKKYSQLGQDDWVLSKHKTGYFVEIGAYDGISLSNTLKLEENGWSGLCVEPNPKLYEQLAKNRKCNLSNLAVHNKSNEKIKFQCGDVYGGIQQYLDHEATKVGINDIIEVTTVTLDDILFIVNAPKNIEYISIDTEGNELLILESFPMDKWNVDLWTIEHNDHVRKNTSRSTALINIFKKYGYKWTFNQFDIWFYK